MTAALAQEKLAFGVLPLVLNKVQFPILVLDKPGARLVAARG